jgi:Tfp pilus assembly protein PilW
MKSQDFLKLLNQSRSNRKVGNAHPTNSGFTLMELLVGLFMSIFVVGALGFGLMQVLRITQSETSKSSARNETSRAIDFISDEIRRAKRIEASAANAPTFTDTGTVVLALEIPEVTTSFPSDAVTTTSERIVYYLKPASGSWRGNLVLYRYGPPIGNNGNYTTGSWGSVGLPLIDNISNRTVTSECAASATTTPATPQGFYACITGTNTAQLYFTGLTKTVTGDNTDNYAANSRAVARVTDAPAPATSIFSSYTWSVKDLGGAYNCSGTGTDEWTIRTDFGDKKWIRDTTRQPQPIAVDSSTPLTITTSPIGQIGCNSRGNDYLVDPESSVDPVTGLKTHSNPLIATNPDGKQSGTWDNLDRYDVKVSHIINFSNPKTFNGDEVDGGSNYNTTLVKKKPDNTTDDPTVQFLKAGSTIPVHGGNAFSQDSLGKFLYDKGYARLVSGTLGSPTAQYAMISSTDTTTTGYPPNHKVLGNDQRIIAFEVGQTNPTNNDGSANVGFDLQDNIFIVTSDVFKKKFASTCFNGGACPTPTN